MKASRKPKALAIVDEQLERRAAPIAEDKQRAGEGIVRELCFAQRHQGVNPLAEIKRLVSEQNLELRDELEHRLQARRKSAHRWASVVRSGAGSVRVRRAPSGRSTWRRHSLAVCLVEATCCCMAGAGNAKKAGAGSAVTDAAEGLNAAAFLSECGWRRQTRQIIEAE
jgi:hypothetical protein